MPERHNHAKNIIGTVRIIHFSGVRPFGEACPGGKSKHVFYWCGAGGDILAETDSNNILTAEYLYFGGKRIAMHPPSGAPQYCVQDMLGCVLTSNTGVVCYDADFYPYGTERPYITSCPQNYKFEGKERDVETNS